MGNESYEKRGYLLEDFRLFHLRGAQGVKAEYHYHEFCKLLLLISGSGGYSVEGQRYNLQPGDIVLVGSRAVHRPEFAPDAPYERVIVYIDPAFLKQSSTPDCDLLAIFNGSHGHVLRPTNPRTLFSLASLLEKDLSEDNYGRVILSTGTLLRLLVQIGLQMQQTDATALPAPIRPQDGRILQIMEYLDAHLHEDLSIDQIAEQFYLSKFHMMRLFRAEIGQSIYSYLTHRRLSKARELIAGGTSATDAAFRCGFGSYSAFTRAYKKQFGSTPTGRNPLSRALDETFE